jgi:hypothetical protein
MALEGVITYVLDAPFLESVKGSVWAISSMFLITVLGLKTFKNSVFFGILIERKVRF